MTQRLTAKPVIPSLKQIAHEASKAWIHRVALKQEGREPRRIAYEQGFFAGMVWAARRESKRE